MCKIYREHGHVGPDVSEEECAMVEAWRREAEAEAQQKIIEERLKAAVRDGDCLGDME